MGDEVRVPDVPLHASPLLPVTLQEVAPEVDQLICANGRTE